MTVFTFCKNTNFTQADVASSGEEFNRLIREVQTNKEWRGAEKTPSIARKSFVRKKFKRHYLSSEQKFASTQNLGSAFLDRIIIVQNLKYEFDFWKKFDCFVDDHVSVHNNYISFLMKK